MSGGGDAVEGTVGGDAIGAVGAVPVPWGRQMEQGRWAAAGLTITMGRSTGRTHTAAHHIPSASSVEAAK